MNTGNHFEQTAARQTRRVRAGGPPPITLPEPASRSQPPSAPSGQDHSGDANEMATGWELLGWGVVAVAATACAVIVAFAIGFYA